MKFTINIDERYEETEIIVNCSRVNDEVEKLIDTIKMLDMKFIGKKNGEQFYIDPSKIIYIESIDKRTFFYTADDVYESSYRLYELEEKLAGQNFLRASKNCIFNIAHLQSIKSDLEQRLQLTMAGNMKVIVSRQYSGAVKEKLEAIYG